MSEDLKILIQNLENNRKELLKIIEVRRAREEKDVKLGSVILAILFFLFGFLWFFLTPAECKADTLYLGAKSHHFNPVGEDIVRESHTLIVYEHRSGWMGGYWRNSYNKDTYSVGYHYYLWKTSNKGEPDMSLGLKAGLVTGYDYPIFGAINVQMGYIDVNIVPTEVVSAGLKFDF